MIVEGPLAKELCEIAEGRRAFPPTIDGEGNALKPAHEPIVMARKPLAGTVARNVLEHGTGALNVDACGIATHGGVIAERAGRHSENAYGDGLNGGGYERGHFGRWPANVLLSHTEACRELGTRHVRANGHHPASRPKGSALVGAAGRS